MTQPVPPSLLRQQRRTARQQARAGAAVPVQPRANQQQQQQPGATPPGASAPVDEFELMRRRLEQRGAASAQGQQRELSRQFASLGNLPSGAAFKIRQQATEAAQQQTSQDIQDVNILQAQTQRAEREGLAQRELQKELGYLGAQTQIGTAQIGAGSAREVANIQGKFGIEQQQLAIGAAKENLATQIASNEKLADLDAATKEYIAGLDFDAKMEAMKIEADTAKYLGQLSTNAQLTIADWDSELKQQGLSIQQMLADSQISATQAEGKLNTAATFINSLAPLAEAGFQAADVQAMLENLDIGLSPKFNEQFKSKISLDYRLLEEAARLEREKQANQGPTQAWVAPS